VLGVRDEDITRRRVCMRLGELRVVQLLVMAWNKMVMLSLSVDIPQQRAYYQMPHHASWLKCRNYQNFTCLSSTLQKDLIPGMPISLGLFPFRQGTGIRTKWMCSVVWCLFPCRLDTGTKNWVCNSPCRWWGTGGIAKALTVYYYTSVVLGT